MWATLYTMWEFVCLSTNITLKFSCFFIALSRQCLVCRVLQMWQTCSLHSVLCVQFRADLCCTQGFIGIYLLYLSYRNRNHTSGKTIWAFLHIDFLTVVFMSETITILRQNHLCFPTHRFTYDGFHIWKRINIIAKRFMLSYT